MDGASQKALNPGDKSAVATNTADIAHLLEMLPDDSAAFGYAGRSGTEKTDLTHCPLGTDLAAHTARRPASGPPSQTCGPMRALRSQLRSRVDHLAPDLRRCTAMRMLMRSARLAADGSAAPPPLGVVCQD